MSYGEFYVERQCWARFPKVLIMCRKYGRMENGSYAVERKRYLPERTCKFNIEDNMNETEGMGDVWIECSSCHCVFDYYADDWLMNMSYCPNCGAKVVSE